MSLIKSIAVFCASSAGNHPKYQEIAAHCGRYFANNTIELVYGGGNVGLMGSVANACMLAGGKVYGVIPHFFKRREVAHPNITKLDYVDTMHERKWRIYEASDAFVILPGGLGTMDEFFEVLTWAQIGIHRKPIGILNQDSFYDLLIQFMHKMVAEGFVKDINLALVIIEPTIEKLVNRLVEFDSSSIPRFLNEDEVVV
jgi:uncharacterized protein (TIGR00730 family)